MQLITSDYARNLSDLNISSKEETAVSLKITTLNEHSNNKLENMCMSKLCNGAGSDGEDTVCEDSPKMNRNRLGRIIRTVLAEARKDSRLICGLLPAIACLDKAADETIMCLLAESRPGDSSAHLQTVLLQAFCYENYIPVIKVDSSEKLAELCGTTSDGGGGVGCQCAIITRDLTIPWNEDDNYSPPMNDVEQSLADFYEATLEEYPSPVVKLPR